MKTSNPSLRKWLLISAGVLSVVLATVGVFLPLLPTTPFLLLAAACFMRSSDGLYEWLTTHKWFGPYIRNYREHRAITKRTKTVVLVLMWTTLVYGIVWVTSLLIVRVLLLVIGVGVTIHLLRLKTLTQDMLVRELVADKHGVEGTDNPGGPPDVQTSGQGARQ